MMIDQMTDTVKITLRNLPKPLHAALKKVAEQNRHSLNDEVVIAIEQRVYDHIKIQRRIARREAKNAAAPKRAKGKG